LLKELGLDDAYLLPEYVKASVLLDPGRPALLHLKGDGGDVVFACIVRDVEGGRADVTTPYGYGGPVAAGSDPPLERFWQEYARWCEDAGVVTTFLRFHPRYANHRDVAPYVRVEPLDGTITWRLDQGDLFDGMHRHHRRIVRKAEAAGVQTSVARAPESLDRFVRLYEQTMDRKDASGFYYFPPEYWHALEAGLRERLVLFEAGDGAALLCFATKPWLHYHLGATSIEGRKAGASNLLFLEAARWAAAEGFTRFHLGGGLGGGEDSLFQFKQRFDPGGRVEMAVGKAVHDEAAYRTLAGDTADTEGFFPAYRRAASTVTA
jgi:serine/alanine adding enzyme